MWKNRLWQQLEIQKKFLFLKKYDEYILEELIRKGFAYEVLDIEQMKKRVSG